MFLQDQDCMPQHTVLINALNARSDAFDGPVGILQNQLEDWAGTGDLGLERLIGLSYEVYDIMTGRSMEIAERRLQASNILAEISQRNGKALQLKRALATKNQKTIHGFDNSIALVRTRLQKLTP